DALRSAHLAIDGALGDLRAAARSAAGNAAEMAQGTAGLRERIERARCIAQSLKKVITGIGRSIEQVAGLRQHLIDSGCDGECDLAALEDEYSRAYTTEIERSILRNALYGEAMRTAEMPLMGNDVELF